MRHPVTSIRHWWRTHRHHKQPRLAGPTDRPRLGIQGQRARDNERADPRHTVQGDEW